MGAPNVARVPKATRLPENSIKKRTTTPYKHSYLKGKDLLELMENDKWYSVKEMAFLAFGRKVELQEKKSVLRYLQIHYLTIGLKSKRIGNKNKCYFCKDKNN